MSELSLVFDQLSKARCPEDVFGLNIKTTYHALLRVVHPDRHNNDPLATHATKLLNELKVEAETRFNNGTWGERLPLPAFELVELGTYRVQRKAIVGDIADVYLAEKEVMKVARNTDDNDLMRAERSTLALLTSKMEATNVLAGVPKLVDSFQHSRREVNVLERIPVGFVSAEEIHRRMPIVDPRTLVWMFKRLLVVLEWSHHCGIVHGAVLPPHVLFRVDDATAKVDQSGHTIRLIDWCYSVEYAKRTRLSSWVPAWKSYYPSELLLKNAVLPASDIYMAALTISGLSEVCGVPAPLQAVINKCLRPKLEERHQKVSEVFDEWVAAAKKVYGPTKWVDFVLSE